MNIKNLFTFLMLILLSFSVCSRQIIPSEPKINAKSWILIDATTGFVILESAADMRLPPASLAKMMTTYITSNEIKNGQLKPDDLINICKNNSLNLNNLIGVKFDILKNEWIVSNDKSINYLAQFSKT